MKKLITLTIAVLFAINLNGTPNSDYYKRVDLKKMNKITLTEIYLNQLNKLFLNLPYTPFTLFGNEAQGDGSVNSRLDVPSTEYFETKRNSTITGSNSFGDLVKKENLEIIPYCDKKEIIRSIMYLQKVNENIRNEEENKSFFLKRMIY